MSYWIEKQGYDVSYISNLDTHRQGERLLLTKGFISVGHDEYWTHEMYDNAMTARNAGVNFAFLSGNAVVGQVPLLPSANGQANRIMRRNSVFYGKEFIQRMAKKRGIKGKIPIAPDAALLIGGRHGFGGVGSGDWVCSNPDHWVFADTEMKKGDSIQGLVGWEWHSDPARDLPGHEILAESPIKTGKGKPKPTQFATIYDGPKGNVVFNAATIWWAQGLSSPPGHVLPKRSKGPDPRVQRMMENVFNRFIK